MASKKYGQLKEYYRLGMWTEEKLKTAVVKNWITSEEYKSITGHEYTA